MTFKRFIYYSAVMGGWGAFLAWCLVRLFGIEAIESPTVRVMAIGVLLGMLVAAFIGLVDAILNASGSQRLIRTLICAAVGLPGGLIGGLLGQVIFGAGPLLFIGWMMAGIFIGASLGVFDVVQAQIRRAEARLPLKKVLNGVYGGVLGGLVGRLPFGLLLNVEAIPLFKLCLGLVILGICIGLLVALAQIFLREAWVLMETGRRAGKQMLLSKEVTTIGRAEGCDIGIFGEQGVEKEHA